MTPKRRKPHDAPVPIPQYAGTGYCTACLKPFGKRADAPIATASSTVAFGIDPDGRPTVVIADLRHDATCPSWRSRRPADGSDLGGKTTLGELFRGTR